MALGSKALVVGALLYGIAPVDMLPDLIPLADCVDDLGVLSYLDRRRG